MEKPALEFVFEIRVDIDRRQLLEPGKTAKGIRRIIPILGGEFQGPGISGTILPGGYDWQLIRPDGVAEIEARYVLKTNDGELITIVNTGLRHGPADVMARLANGTPVEPHEYYFRSVPSFEARTSQYDWLNRHIFVANGVRRPSQVLIEVWKIN